MRDLEKFISGLHEYFGKALQPLANRIKTLEERELPEAIKGDPGDKGEDGKDGVDGTSVTLADLPLAEWQATIERMAEEGRALVASAVADLRQPENGKDGERGKDGIDGKSFTFDEVRALVREAVEAEQAKWALEFERHATGVLERAIERMPKPQDGKDGEHGLGFDDLSVADDGEGNVTLRFARGEVVKEHSLRLPILRDCGVWTAERSYAKGDGVTFGGSFWIAQKDAPEGKPGLSEDWRLAVKKGRDLTK